MAGKGMEKRVAGIVRWLERFQHSYRSGAIESALMDAECARADLETLRRDVWSALDPSYLSRRRKGKVVFRAVLLAFLAVLTVSAPVSELRRSPVLEDVAVHSSHDFFSAWAAWMAVNALDSGLTPEKNGFAEADSDPPPVSKGAPSSRGTAPVRRNVAFRPLPAAEKGEGRQGARATKKGKKVPYETVFSLLQTGERVLRNEEPVIVVDRGQGKGEGGL